jgi:hypothetical protein
MIIKLTRDVEVGRMGEVMNLPYQRATYLIRMGAALEWKQTAEVTDDVELTEAEAVKSRVVKKKKTSGRAAGKTAGKTAKKTAKK